MNKTVKGFLLGVVSVVVVALLISATDKDYMRGKNLEIFFNVFREINLSYVDEPDPNKLVHDALDGMLSELDPYTEYMQEDEFQNFEELTSGEYAGVGAVIFKHPDSLFTEITEVVENSPAHKAGLVMGDKLLYVDTTNLSPLMSADVSKLLRGDAGSKFKLRYKSLLSGEEKEVEIKRERIHSPAVPYFGYINGSDGVGYINLSTFSENCSSEVRRAVEKLKSQGDLKSLMIDLRDNGGGVLQEAVNIVALFVDKGTEVVSIKGRSRGETKVFKTVSEPIARDIPLAILVNNSSASASEVLSGALQDLDRALIVGTQTFGKGLVQSPVDVGYGSVLKMTTAKYYTPSGRCIQAIDFSNRNSDGSVGAIADSLKSEFKTLSGRIVYDGGGIMPDSIVESKKPTRFVQNVANVGSYLNDYVKLYFKNNRETPEISTFSISDEDLDDFADYLKNREFKVISLTNYYVDKLKESAEDEYYLSKIEDELSSLESKLKLDINEDVELNREEIKRLLEMDIICAYHYQRGRMEHYAQTDPLVERTVGYLSNKD